MPEQNGVARPTFVSSNAPEITKENAPERVAAMLAEFDHVSKLGGMRADLLRLQSILDVAPTEWDKVDAAEQALAKAARILAALARPKRNSKVAAPPDRATKPPTI